MGDDPRQPRRRLVRAVNEEIHRLNVFFGLEDGHCQLLCECAGESCVERVRLPLPVYDEVRARHDRFVILPAHHDPARERVLADAEGYRIVRPTS